MCMHNCVWCMHKIRQLCMHDDPGWRRNPACPPECVAQLTEPYLCFANDISAPEVPLRPMSSPIPGRPPTLAHPRRAAVGEGRVGTASSDTFHFPGADITDARANGAMPPFAHACGCAERLGGVLCASVLRVHTTRGITQGAGRRSSPPKRRPASLPPLDSRFAPARPFGAMSAPASRGA